jgi:hypothetical protein
VGRRSRTRLFLILPALLVTLVLAACGTPAVKEKAVGVWRETGQAPAYTMRIERAADGTYTVTYRRWFLQPERYVLQDGKLLGGGENTMTDSHTITYDAGSDELTIGNGTGTEHHTLRRVSP